MKSQLIDALAANLEDEIGVQKRLLESLKDQRVRLLEGGMSGLEGSTDRTRELLEKTDSNRTRRASVLRSLGVDSSNEKPIETVAQCALPDRGGRLLELRRSLIGISTEVRALNSFNAQLIRRSAEVVNGLLSILTGLSNVPGYDTSGAVRHMRPGGVLVNQEC